MEAIEHPSPLVALINLLFAPLGIHVPDHMVFVALITLLILFIGLAIRSSLSVENPGKLQIILEDVVSFLVGVLEGFRWSLVAGELRWAASAYSAAMAVVFVVAGVLVFRRMERRFADVV